MLLVSGLFLTEESASTRFDFRSDNAEYHNGSGGEWRILRNGHLYKTDPHKIEDPTAWTEPTPFHVLDVVDQMTITETADEDTIFRLCKRFTGTAFSAGVPRASNLADR
jgi:hypothetical protein